MLLTRIPALVACSFALNMLNFVFANQDIQIPHDPYLYMDQIAIAAGTDKSSSYHNYTKIYSRYFDSLRDKPLKFLEIGIFKGNSVKLWEDYFPFADLHFIDVNPDIIEYFSPRSKYHFADQADAASLQALAQSLNGNFDIIIDDGGHRMDQQIISFITLFPFLKPGGMYVIEDLCTSYWQEYGGHGWIGNPISGPGTCMEFLKCLIDQINYPAGVTKCADLNKIPTDLYEKLNNYQKSIESIHFYQSLAIIIKR